MTIGQRIAQKRKELGLSQEALGDQMGVSRQAIYKWESDATLPEIEKLIALSKLFSVSVGWLLGVEEDAASRQTEPDTLNQDQLDMVEEIVHRYIEAQHQPKPRRKWPWILVACILVVVLIQLFSRIDQLSNQYSNLQNSVASINGSVSSQINNIANRVESILMAQNQLTAEYKTEVTATDYRSGTLTISAKAVPKTYTQGMRAVFLVDCGNGPEEFEGVLSDGIAFTAEVTVPLTDNIAVSVVFVSADGTRQTQVLDTYSCLLSDSYAEVGIDDYDLLFMDVVDGKLTLTNFYFTASKIKNDTADPQIEEVKLGLFKNQQLLGWAEPCGQPANYIGDYTGRQFYRLPDLTVENLTEGDAIAIAALVTDSYGRQYMSCDMLYEVDIEYENGNGDLSYASSVEYDRDPACWTFD